MLAARQVDRDPLPSQAEAQVIAGQPPLLEVLEAAGAPPVAGPRGAEGPVPGTRLEPEHAGRGDQQREGERAVLHRSGHHDEEHGEESGEEHQRDAPGPALHETLLSDDGTSPRAQQSDESEGHQGLERGKGQEPVEDVRHGARSILLPMRSRRPLRKHFAVVLPLLLAVTASACRSTGDSDADSRVYGRAGQAVAFEAMLDDLAEADVVFLGEEHDNDVGHRLQLEALRGLAARRPEVIVTLEQFESDVQVPLDLYLAGAIDEERFLAESRPWGNYPEHYRPIIEFARANGIPVVAANVPRPLARIVAYEGLDAVAGRSWVPWSTWTQEPEYAARFARAMGRTHMAEDDVALQRWFSAQCVKDSQMAQSIAVAWRRARTRGGSPLVVHLCGKFHSDYGLGTVSRLARRQPTLDIRVVGMESGGDLDRAPDKAERAIGDYIWRVPSQR